MLNLQCEEMKWNEMNEYTKVKMWKFEIKMIFFGWHIYFPLIQTWMQNLKKIYLTKMQTPYEGTWAVLVVDDSEEGMIIDMLFCKTMKKG